MFVKRLVIFTIFWPALAFGVERDFLHNSDPPLETDPQPKVVARFDPRLKPLWLKALARPEIDLKRQAAEALARAHTLGMRDLDDAVPLLIHELETSNEPIVKRSAARTLIVLDARKADPALVKFAQSGGIDAALLVEPTLARWNVAEMRPVWLARLENPGTQRTLLVLSIHALADLKLSQAAGPLRNLVMDSRVAGDVRLEAARALASLRTKELEGDARTLAGKKTIVDRVLAATLLSQHHGETAETLLVQLARDPEPAVASVAVNRLVALEPSRLQPFVKELASSKDAGLRRLAAQALGKLGTAESVALLGPLLDDPHREVRVLVRETLVRLGMDDKLTAAVRSAVLTELASDKPRALEQAGMVVGALKIEPAADRLLQLLGHAEAEVRNPAGWALRRLALPATAARIHQQVQLAMVKYPPFADSEGGPDPGEYLEHLIEALGVLRHQPAIPALTEYLPLPPVKVPPEEAGNPRYRQHLRVAALWSLGKIAADNATPDLVEKIKKRLTTEDDKLPPGAPPPPPADSDPMREMAAVALGRMKAKEFVPVLRSFYANEETPRPVRRACAWAIAQITGETVPPLKPAPTTRDVYPSGWFLEPLGK